MAVSTSLLQPTIPGDVSPQAPRTPYREPVIGLGQGEGDLARGVEALDTGLQQRDRVVQAQNNELAHTRAMDSVGKIHEWAQGQLTTAMTTAQGADPGFTGKFNKTFDDYVGQMVENEPSEVGKRVIARSSIPIRTTMVDQAQHFQAAQIFDTKVKTANDVADQFANIVANDRAQYDATFANYQNTLQGMGLPPSTQQKLADQASVKLKTAAVQNWIANDPRGAYQALSTRLGVPNAAQPTLPAPSTPGQLTITTDAATPEARAEALSQRDLEATLSPGEIVKIATDARKSGADSFTVPARQLSTGNAVQMPVNTAAVLDAPAVKVAMGNPATASDVRTFAYQPDAQPLDTKIPYIDGLPLDHVLTLRNQAHSQIQQGMSQARVALERDLQGIEAAAKTGSVAPDISKDRFYAAYDPATAEAKYAQMGEWQQFGTDVRTIQPMSQNDMEQYLASINPTPPAGQAVPANYATKIARFNALTSAASHVLEQRQKDPMLMAGASGMGKVNAINLSDPAATVGELANRQHISASLTGAWAPDVPPLTAREAQAFGGILRTAPVSQQLQILDSFRKGLTDPGTYMRAMQQIQPDAPELGIAGVLASKGQAGAAELILNGAALLHPARQDKATDGAGKAPLMPDEGALKAAFADGVGDAFRGDVTGRSADQAYQAFRYYYAGSAARDGALVDTNKNPDGKRVNDAINGAIGGVVDWNSHKVVKPYGMPDDTFKTIFANEFTQSMQRNGYTFGDKAGATPAMPLDAYTPVALGDGRYLLQAGAGYLPNSPGRGGGPMVIQIPDYVAPTGPEPATFLQRVTGALPSASKTQSAGAFEGAQP